MKSILLLTDFSDSADNAIQYALQLFKEEPCTFHVLYVHKASSYTTVDLLTNPSESIYKSLLKKPKKKLKEYVASLEATHASKNTKFHALVDYDPLVDAINQLSKSTKIDLVVMGSNGATGAKEIIFGSNTLHVIRKVDCNTLIIPEKCRFTAPKTMVLPVDASDRLDGKEMVGFLKFVEQHNLAIHILRFRETSDFNSLNHEDMVQLNRQVPSKDFVYKHFGDLSIDKIVSDYIQQNDIDMMSLFVQKEHLFERLFFGSPTTQINRHSEIPLLIFHSQP